MDGHVDSKRRWVFVGQDVVVFCRQSLLRVGFLVKLIVLREIVTETYCSICYVNCYFLVKHNFFRTESLT
jgi:hypothetical protein